jgi:pimeloyl-ACP methyl ester carboxylesterase
MNYLWKKQIVTIDGNTLEYIEKGEGEVVICLHAIPGSYEDYSGILETLAGSHRMIAVAWPGYGIDPDAAADVGLTSPIYFAYLFQQFLMRLNIKKAIVVGNSVGGYVAIRAAIDVPQIVRGLVLINTAGFTNHNFFTRLFCKIKGSRLGTRILAYPLALIYLRKRNSIVLEMLGRAKKISQEPRLIGIEAAMWRAFLRSDSDLRSLVAELKIPLLVFWGKKDCILPWFTDGKSCMKSLPSARLVLMNTGHAPHAEAPELFIREFEMFVKIVDNPSF